MEQFGLGTGVGSLAFTLKLVLTHMLTLVLIYIRSHSLECPHDLIVAWFGLGSGSEEVFLFDSKSENRDKAVEAVEAVSEARAV